MIKNAEIHNFKGLTCVTLEGLARVTLLGGRNNVGKTSLLEALFLYYDRHNPEALLRQYAWRGVPGVPLHPDALWAPVFTMYDMGQPILIQLQDEQGALSSLTLQLNPNFVRRIPAGQSFTPGMPAQIDTQAKPTPTLSLEVIHRTDPDDEQRAHHFVGPQGVGMETEYEPSRPESAVFLAAATRVNPQEDAVRFGQLDIKGRQQEVVDFLRDTIEPRLKGLSVISLGGPTTMIHAQLEGLARKIPVAYMGDGMARLLSIILILATTTNGCIFIDEIENGIHHSALPRVWQGIVKAARQFNCQVFATTHSQECLQAAVQGIPVEMKDEFCYVRLEKSGEKILGKTYAHDVLGAALERGWEVR